MGARVSWARLRSSRVAKVGVFLVVYVAIALGIGLVLVLATPGGRHPDGVNMTVTSARALRSAVEIWRAEHAEGDCPTAEMLVQGRQIDVGSKLTDPWDSPFVIVCEPDETVVYSLGPDRKDDHGLGDDVRVSPRATR